MPPSHNNVDNMYVEEPELGMQYNTQRGGMQIPEYGRNVQKMVAYCLTVEDAVHRNEVAHSIIDVIGNLNPHLRDIPDYRHKLWDHLFIMSGFNCLLYTSDAADE